MLSPLGGSVCSHDDADLASPEILATALRYIDENELKPRDAIHAATMEVIGLNEILSEDGHFDRVGWGVDQEVPGRKI